MKDMTEEQKSSLLQVQVPLMEALYKMRYLMENGTKIDKSMYETRIAAIAADPSQPKVYRAAYVGCTYHSA